jgi:flagellar biogenesis protein FliO
MMRFIVVVTGLFTISLGRAVEQAGGVFAVTFGLVIQVVGVLIVAIAIGAVEWLVRRMRRRAPARRSD